MNYKSGVMILLVVTITIISLLPNIEGTHKDEDLLNCNDFNKNKVDDCKYILSQGLNEDEEQELLQILLEQPYRYDEWKPQDYEINPDLLLKTKEIDNSRIVLASRIIILGLFNYFIFSFLTKSSFIAKWLTVA